MRAYSIASVRTRRAPCSEGRHAASLTRYVPSSTSRALPGAQPEHGGIIAPHSPHHSVSAFLLHVTGALLSVLSTAGAQSRPNPPTADTLRTIACDGQLVSAIHISPAPPPSRGAARVWRAVARSVGLPYLTTQQDVIRGMLQVRVGERCTELRRAESERVLRAQPFLAAASVRAVADSLGADGAIRVRLVVATVDEVPVTLAARLRGVVPQTLTIGNGNVGGRAVGVTLNAERGHAYRDGIGIRLEHHAIANAPLTGELEAQRRPLGSMWAIDVTRPYYTDLQPTAWHVGVRGDDVYRRLVRPGGDPVALRIHQRRWELGGLHRRRLFSRGALVGVALTGVRDTPAQYAAFVTDSGLVIDPDTVLRGRYAPFRVVRPAVLLGARHLRFVAARGFNTLGAVEDLPSGVQLGAVVGRGLQRWGANDVALAGTLYAGRATTTSLLGMQLEIEGRRDFDEGGWNGLVASGRLAWYRRQLPQWTFIASSELAGGTRARLPLQLTLGDREGGLAGYRGSSAGGAWRVVSRLEQRWRRATPIRNAELGAAGFVEAGHLWAGSAPYGQSVAFRGTIGMSVLAAYPVGSRRLLRLDVAVPSARDGNRSMEVRVSAVQMIGRFWREPADVTRARTGPAPSTLFTWPVR